MENYAIMRVEKIKKIETKKASLKAALLHNTREKPPRNADPERAKNNSFFGGSSAECLDRFYKNLPEKYRTNAVLAVEFVLTASDVPPVQNWEKYLKACDQWAMEIMGVDPANKLKGLIHIAHHYDELTPHSHILIMPLKDGKLNAKYYIGGHRNRLSDLQEDFWQKVGKPFGLDRGKPHEETRAEHTPHNLFNLKAKEGALKLTEKQLRKEWETTTKELAAREAAANETQIRLQNLQAGLARKESEISAARKEIEQQRRELTDAANDLDMGAKLIASAIKGLRDQSPSKNEKNLFWQRLVDALPAFAAGILKKIRSEQKKSKPDNLQKSISGHNTQHVREKNGQKR